MKRIFKAPGKLFLFGEYAVLGGGWSVVIAVDRYVIATIDPAGTAYDTGSTLVEDPLRLPRAVLESAGPRARGILEEHLSTDIKAFYDEGYKLGLGSSAASTVALTKAVLDGTGPVFEVAAQAHRTLQGGRGSGADVAAATFGGVLAYRLTHPCSPFPELKSPTLPGSRALWEAEVASLSWPQNLKFAAIWTGEPASSTKLMSVVEAALETTPNLVVPILQEIAATGYDAARAMALATLDYDWLDITRRADTALTDLGRATGAPIITDRHRALRTLASRYGLAAKPSGAGGGDFTLVLGPPDADWEGFAVHMPGTCRKIDLKIERDQKNS